MPAPVIPRRVSGNAFSLPLVAALLFLATLVCHAQEDEQADKTRNFLEEEHVLSMEFETPHTDWAKPYAGGTTHVLFFTTWYQGSTDAREIIELMQRFDLDAKAVYSAQGPHLIGDGNPDWYGGDKEAGTKRALQLLDGPCDAVFLNHLEAGALPTAVQEKLHQKVAEGAGLVLVSAKLPFEDAQPITPRPADWTQGESFTLGKGRIAVLPAREKLVFRPGWETDFDYQMEQQGRALLWAARHAPKMSLTLQAAKPIQERSTLPAPCLNVTCGNPTPGTEVHLVLRHPNGQKTALGTWTGPEAASATITLPQLPEGDYHVDAFALRGSAIENWATLPLQIEADHRIASLVLEKDWAEIGETVTGHIAVSDARHAHDRIEMRLVDKRGRMLEKQEFKASGDAVQFRFRMEPWMPMLLRAEAHLLEDDDEIASASIYLRVTKRHRDQFNVMMWNSPSGDLAPYGVESLARHGVTTILQGGEPPLSFADNELSFVPYAQSFRASSHTTTAMLDPTTGWLKSGCVYDRGSMLETVKKTVEAAQKAREMGVFVYSLGDENAVRASCLSPYCLDAYRAYLRTTYRDIASLNREWNTDYRAFDAIELLSDGDLPAADAPKWFRDYFAEQQQLFRTDSEGAKGDDLEKQVAFGNINDEMRALQAGNFARWYDRQAFQNQTYVEWCIQFRQAFKKVDPQAWTGFEGTDSFSIRKFTTRSRQGGDLDRFVREMDYFGPYEGPANEVVRSIARPGFPMGNWIGYDPSAETLLRAYWGQVTDCMNTAQWWRYDNLDGYHGYLMPTLVPFPAVRELLDDTQIVRDGLGTLLMHCTMQDDGIAMLYSLPSTYIAHFDGNDTYGDYKRDHAAWHTLLHNAGLQFRYVTDRMLRQGEFDAAHYKVLILPLAFAMTPEEAAAVRSFAQNGGTVIADLRPALCDGHCKPLDTGLLDDLFGLRRGEKKDAMLVDRASVEGQVAGHAVAMRWGNWHGHDVYPQMKVDPSVELTTGKGLGDAFHVHYWAGLKTPICIVNEVGKGRAILLNFSVFDAPPDRLLSGLLEASGVKPAVHVTKAAGQGQKGIEVTRWADGNMELLALLGDYSGEVKVALPESRTVYDLRAHAQLGNVTEFTPVLKPNRATFFALSPQPIAAPRLKLRETAVERGTTVQATVSIPRSEGKHAVMIRATTPAGDNAEWLDTTLMVGSDSVALTLPFALNDPPGQWQIRATELLSGEMTTATVTLK
jgi:beta-galactosidase